MTCFPEITYYIGDWLCHIVSIYFNLKIILLLLIYMYAFWYMCLNAIFNNWN